MAHKSWAVTVDHHDKADISTHGPLRFGWPHALVNHNNKKKSRSEVNWLQREVMSSTINGGDVDCSCVWIHKIYSSGLSLLSGASKCIQTINYPLLLLLLLSHFLCCQSSNVLRKHLFTELHQCAYRRRRCVHLSWRYDQVYSTF